MMTGVLVERFLYEDAWTSPCATNIVGIVAIRGNTYRFCRYIYTPILTLGRV